MDNNPIGKKTTERGGSARYPAGLAGTLARNRFTEEEIRAALLRLNEELYTIRASDAVPLSGQVGMTCGGEISSRQTGGAAEVLAVLPPLPLENLGDPELQCLLRHALHLLRRRDGLRHFLG